MDGLFPFIYSRAFRLLLTIAEAIVVAVATLFVVSSDVDVMGKAVLLLCIIISAWEVVLALSLYVVTKESVDRIISLIMYTTRRSSLRLYVFAVNIFVYLLAVLYVIEYSPGVPVVVLLLLPVFILIWDKTNSLYMSFIIAQIADKESDDVNSKKDPKNPLQK